MCIQTRGGGTGETDQSRVKMRATFGRLTPGAASEARERDESERIQHHVGSAAPSRSEIHS